MIDEPNDAVEGEQHGRHELPEDPPPVGRSRPLFGALAILLCLVLGVAIATQVRQTKSGDALDTARPADLLVLLDSLRQREATLNTEVSELQNTLNSLRASVRVGVDTWVTGAPGSLTVDAKTLSPPYSILAIGDPPTLAAAMNIPGGALDSIRRVGARMSVQQANRLDVTTLRQPKPHQYAQPVK